MKKRIAFGVLLCVALGFVLGSTTVTKTASWSDPESKGIIFMQK